VTSKRCTSHWAWKVRTGLTGDEWSEVWWTSNPCGFKIEDRSTCQGTHGQYYTYSGRVKGINIKDRASCTSWTDAIKHAAKEYLTASGWVPFATYWNDA